VLVQESEIGMKKETWALIIAIVLTVMILNDFSLHLVELLGEETSHPFFWFFWGPWMSIKENYTEFWTTYWGAAFLFILILLILVFQMWDQERSVSHKRRPPTPRAIVCGADHRCSIMTQRLVSYLESRS
jgi:magnesium-transporting ATPase (P-type)